MSSNVSEEYIGSIIRDEHKASKKPAISTRCMTKPQYTFDMKWVENSKFEMTEKFMPVANH
jgi:hypothetical protein